MLRQWARTVCSIARAAEGLWASFLALLIVAIVPLLFTVLYILPSRMPIDPAALVLSFFLAVLFLASFVLLSAANSKERWRASFRVAMPEGVQFMRVVAFSKRRE